MLVAGSIAVRVVYFVQLSRSPIIELHRVAQFDTAYYHDWGRAIAEGDWLSASVGVPVHPWHEDVAAAAFGGTPDRAATARLWTQWNGEHQFYQDPLYAYLVALTYRVFGPNPEIVFAWQLGLGVLTTVLIYAITRRFFGELAAAIAGLLALFCGPLLSYELLLLRDSTIAFAGLGLVWLTDRARERQRAVWFVALGLALGLAILLKSTFILYAALVVPVVLWRLRDHRRQLAMACGALAAGLAIALTPAAARNVALGVPPLAWAGSGALTFVASNDVSYPPEGGFHVNPSSIAAIMGKTGGQFLPAVVETLRPHSPATLAALVWHKVDNVWRWYEIPNMVSFYYMRRFAPVLAWLPVTFYVIGPFALVGLVLALRQRTEAMPLYALAGCLFVSLVAFLVIGRLRLPLMAAVIPFAGFAVASCIRGRLRTRIALLASALVCLMWTGRPLAESQSLIPPSDWMTPFAVRYQERIKQALDRQDGAAAAAAYRDFLAFEPDFQSMPVSQGVLERATDRDLARTFASIHTMCARLLEGAGRVEEAGIENHAGRVLFALSGDR